MAHVVVLINGAFGVGKTTVARLVVALLPNSMLYDPEVLGSCVRQLAQEVRWGDEATDDYQDIALWRELTIYTAQQLYTRYARSLVIPMTLATLPCFREIRAGLASLDQPGHHFCLTASQETIHERLARRGDTPDSWPFQQMAR